ncbi:MAG: hypothetical protein K1X81_01950 [Bacteroidia bacterium]|nr:hypothetical protein [Bacteroidia bacterium]
MAIVNREIDFEQIGRDLLKQIPHDVGQMALSHFKGSFRKQGFTDYGFVAWPKRKDHFSHKILMLTNSLMQDLKVREERMSRIELSTTLPYGIIHNNGGVIRLRVSEKMRKFFWAMFKKTQDEKWKGLATTKKRYLTIRIPKRQYIGHSHVLNKKIDNYLLNKIETAFKKGLG